MDSTLETSGLLTETYLQLRITNEVSERICMYLVTVLLLQPFGALTILYHHWLSTDMLESSLREWKTILVGFSLAQVVKWWSWWKLNLMVVMMIDEDENRDEDSNCKPAAMLQDSSLERHWLQCYLKPPGSLEKKGPTEIMLKQLLGTSTPAYFHTSWSRASCCDASWAWI